MPNGETASRFEGFGSNLGTWEAEKQDITKLKLLSQVENYIWRLGERNHTSPLLLSWAPSAQKHDESQKHKLAHGNSAPEHCLPFYSAPFLPFSLEDACMCIAHETRSHLNDLLSLQNCPGEYVYQQGGLHSWPPWSVVKLSALLMGGQRALFSQRLLQVRISGVLQSLVHDGGLPVVSFTEDAR